MARVCILMGVLLLGRREVDGEVKMRMRWGGVGWRLGECLKGVE